MSGGHWFGKGGGRVPGKATLDRWAAWVAESMIKRHPHDPRQGRVDVYKHVESTDEHGGIWDTFVKLTSRIVSAKRRPPP